MKDKDGMNELMNESVNDLTRLSVCLSVSVLIDTASV